MTSKVSLVREGERYGKLVVQEFTERHDGAGKGDSMRYWRCACDCGNVTWARADRLAYGNTQSCGCKAIDSLKRQVTRYERLLARALERYDAVSAVSAAWKEEHRA